MRASANIEEAKLRLGKLRGHAPSNSASPPSDSASPPSKLASPPSNSGAPSESVSPSTPQLKRKLSDVNVLAETQPGTLPAAASPPRDFLVTKPPPPTTATLLESDAAENSSSSWKPSSTDVETRQHLVGRRLL